MRPASLNKPGLELTAIRFGPSLHTSHRASLIHRRVFLSLALFNQDKFDDAEESYKRAIQDAPSQPLARQVSLPPPAHILGADEG